MRVYWCVLFVNVSNDVQLFQGSSEKGNVLPAYGFFWPYIKLGQYADQELLKSLFQNKTPDLSLKYILIQVHDQQGQQ